MHQMRWEWILLLEKVSLSIHVSDSLYQIIVGLGILCLIRLIYSYPQVSSKMCCYQFSWWSKIHKATREKLYSHRTRGYKARGDRHGECPQQVMKQGRCSLSLDKACKPASCLSVVYTTKPHQTAEEGGSQTTTTRKTQNPIQRPTTLSSPPSFQTTTVSLPFTLQPTSTQTTDMCRPNCR